MTNHRSFALATLLALFLFSPSVAHAQRGARTAGRVAPSRGANARFVSVRPTVRPAWSAGARANRLVPGFNFTGTPVFFRNSNHNRDLAFARRFRNRGFFPGGAYFLWDGGPEYVAPDDTADYDQAEQSDQAEQAEQSPPDVVAEQPPTPQPESVPTAAPLVPGDDHLTLVLRNGDKIQAVAFTRANDSIVYITPAGLRHTLALSDLDTAATLRINQEQGKFLQSSSL
ncbi:MAG: hypothetical protein WA405_11185 [Candidatus Acidiferrales bacterium]